MFSRKTLHIRIYRNQFHVVHDDGSTAKYESPLPFSSERLLIADFDLAQHKLGQLLKAHCGHVLLAPSIIFYPMECLSGGFSKVEKTLLIQLGSTVGAKVEKINVSASEIDPFASSNPLIKRIA